MSENLDKIKDRIHKLLRVAENDAATSGEIDNAIRFATNLMTKHNLTREDVGERDDETGQFNLADVEFAQLAGSYSNAAKMATWEKSVAWFICDLVESVSWFTRSRQLKRTAAGILATDEKGHHKVATEIVFYGPADDADFARDLFRELTIAIAAMARLKWGSFFCGSGGSYCEGFIAGLTEAHRKEVAKIKTESDGRALMVQSQEVAAQLKNAAVNWLKKSEGITLKTGRGSSGVTNLNREAFSGGRADGRRYEITRSAKPKRLG